MRNAIDRFSPILKALVGLEDDIERIVKPITKISRKLAKHSAAEQQRAQAATETAARKLSEAEKRRNTAARAGDLAAKYEGLLGN